MRSEVINQDRRELLGAAVMGIAGAVAASLFPRSRASAAATDAIRPFRIDVPEQDLVNLRRRLAATRWPDKETVADESQGVPLVTLQQLVRHWQTGRGAWQTYPIAMGINRNQQPRPPIPVWE